MQMSCFALENELNVYRLSFEHTKIIKMGHSKVCLLICCTVDCVRLIRKANLSLIK